MDGLSLLSEAEAAGLRVTTNGEKLVIVGPKAAEGVARKLLAHKPVVLAALQLLARTRSAGSRCTDTRCAHTLHHDDDGASWQIVLRGSRQAVVCTQCGRFYGYMPMDRLKPSDN